MRPTGRHGLIIESTVVSRVIMNIKQIKQMFVRT